MNGFGVLLNWKENKSIADLVASLDVDRQSVLNCFYRSNGLMVIRGLNSLKDNPQLLVKLSGLFGPEIENYWNTLTSKRFFHSCCARNTGFVESTSVQSSATT